MLTPRERNELAAEIAQQVVDMLNAQAGKPMLVDVHGLATALAVSPSTIERWTASGRIPVKLRLGSVRRYAVDEVLAALSQAREAS